MQMRRLVVAKGLQGRRDLQAELKAFTFSLNARGHDSYQAASGHHDDLVLALCLAIWSAERRLARGGRRPGARLKFYGPSHTPVPRTVLGAETTSGQW